MDNECRFESRGTVSAAGFVSGVGSGICRICSSLSDGSALIVGEVEIEVEVKVWLEALGSTVITPEDTEFVSVSILLDSNFGQLTFFKWGLDIWLSFFFGFFLC